MVSCSFVQLCCVMTPCFFLFGASSHPYIPLSFWRNDFSTCISDALWGCKSVREMTSRMAGLGGAHNEKAGNQYVFTKSRLPLKKWLLLMQFWLHQFHVTTAALNADISKSLSNVIWHLQHHRRRPHHQIWVFGMVDTFKEPGLGYMEVVPSRDANTLLPIVEAHTAPGTTIPSNQWQANSNVITLPAVHGHGLVNHYLHFVDPGTGVHT